LTGYAIFGGAGAGNFMKELRYFLLAASLVGACSILYVLFFEELAAPGAKLIVFVLFVPLFLNFVYLLLSPPEGRHLRLRVWLDTQDSEFPERAGHPPKPTEANSGTAPDINHSSSP
jgi:hypothetical protein